MKKLCFLFLILSSGMLLSQNNSSRNIYLAKVKTTNGMRTGVLLAASDTTLTIIPNFSKKKYQKGIKQLAISIPANIIKQMHFTEYGSIGRGIIIGGSIGGGTGFLIGSVIVLPSQIGIFRPKPDYTPMIGLSLLGAGLGATIGGGIANNPENNKTFFIDQQPAVLSMYLIQLQSYCLAPSRMKFGPNL